MAFKFSPQLIPLSPGVYIFRDKSNKPLYVGKAMNLRQRVSSYFQKGIDLMDRTQLMVGQINKVETIQTETELEALLLEADLIKRLKPKYNVAWKDDKRYKFIKISNFKFLISKKSGEGDWPYVTTSRKTDDPKVKYFGPFPEGQTVNGVLRSLRKVFPWCKYKNARAAKRAGDNKKGCFYYQIGLCPGICKGLISLEEYQAIISNLVRVLSGKSRVLLKEWEKEMQVASTKQNFEDAAKYRDLIQKLQYVTQSFHETSEYLENPNLVEDQRQLETDDLVKTLKPFFSDLRPLIPDFRIEAYDISNFQGQFATGAKVTFVDGEPQRNEYRRYKIHLNKNQLPNDIAALREVLSRRFKDFKKDAGQQAITVKVLSFGKLPHLILIDGGKAQVGAALKVLQEFNLEIPVIGLAKRLEEIIIPLYSNLYQGLSLLKAQSSVSYETLRLPKSSSALKLLQRIRDEVHRFAVGYHRKLRAKAVIETKTKS